MNEKPTSPAEVLVLGMLYPKPIHGYELNKLIEERGIRQWANIGFSSIYYLLEKLESRGLVKSNGEKSKARKTYAITAAGKKACAARTKELVENRVPNKNPFMTGLANSFVLTDTAFTELLESRMEYLNVQLADLKRTAKDQGPLPKQAEYLFSFTTSNINSEIKWIKKVLESKATTNRDPS